MARTRKYTIPEGQVVDLRTLAGLADMSQYDAQNTGSGLLRVLEQEAGDATPDQAADSHKMGTGQWLIFTPLAGSVHYVWAVVGEGEIAITPRANTPALREPV